MKRHPYGIIDPSLQVDTADNILDEIFQITGQLKIKTCLVFGLCLGFIREGKYLEGDNDLDVGVICNGRNKIILIDSLKKNGFNQGRSYRYNNTHFYKNKVLVDIFFLEAKGFYSSFDSVQYKGKAYPVPHPIKEFLSACYSNWKIKETQTARYISPDDEAIPRKARES